MPLGKKVDNYTIFVFINVMDSLGAFTTVETSIKVCISGLKFDIILFTYIFWLK